MTEYKPISIYRLEIKSVSPLSIGSGNNEFTDSDVIVDSNGQPFIPASSLAGVLRSALPQNDARKLFGYCKSSKNDESKEYDSCIRIYDGRAVPGSDDFYIATRDCVKLKDKVGVRGAKFDMQAVEPGTVFVSFIELLDTDYEQTTEALLGRLNNGELRLGTKTTRGYGRISVSVKKKLLPDIHSYIKFEKFDDEMWKNISAHTLPKTETGTVKVSIKLKSRGGISIREYSTDVDRPDYETMSYHGIINKDTPVIPGTSWAGAFRSRFEEFAGEEAAKSLFGYVYLERNNEEKAVKSKIYFSESKLANGTWKETTRNSIDRFSGATKNGALYTERTYYYGETELDIVFKEKPSPEICNAFCCVLADLHFGFLAVGGLTAIGRGLFELVDVNGSDVKNLLNSKTIDMEGLRKAVFGDD